MKQIEKRGKNSWRICAVATTENGTETRIKTIRMDPSLTEDQQLVMAKREHAIMVASLSGVLTCSHTVRTWSEEWITKILEPDCSPVTIANYRHLLDSRILPYLGDVPLADLTPTLLTDWLIRVRQAPRKSTRLPDQLLSHPRSPSEKLAPPSYKKKPLSTNTVNHYYTCLNNLLNAAVRLGYLEQNPMDRVKRPHQRKQQLTILSEEGAARMIRDVSDAPEPYRRAVLLALLCGLRLGELVALRWKDLDLVNNYIHVAQSLKYVSGQGSFLGVPKTESSARDVAIPPSLAAMLRSAVMDDLVEVNKNLGIDEPQRDPVWVIHGKADTPMHKDTPSKWFRRFADAHGFQGLRFHDLRHAHASILVAHNHDVAAVAARLGHSDPSITIQTYTHAFRAGDLAAAGTMDAFLLSSLPPDVAAIYHSDTEALPADASIT